MRYYNYQVLYFIRGLKEPILSQSFYTKPAYIEERTVFNYKEKQYYIFNYVKELTDEIMLIKVYLDEYSGYFIEDKEGNVSGPKGVY